jgi:hypothetical protein|tara:strand:- start:3219 stop:3614 length:396 start_codon:yes stop_codon:yes gene_type:complete
MIAPKEPSSPTTRKIGRPTKKAVASKKAGSRNAVGRPKGDAAIINEYKARMLNSPKSRKVLDAILNAALNDEHKNQAAAWKLVVDRIMPVSAFDQIASNGGRTSVNITISGLKDVAIDATEPLEADYEEID